jgi:hypothetical protein
MAVYMRDFLTPFFFEGCEIYGGDGHWHVRRRNLSVLAMRFFLMTDMIH